MEKNNPMKMIKLAAIIIGCILTFSSSAQITAPKFGKGLRIMAQDSSFSMKIGFRFQTLFQADWNLVEDDIGSLESNSARVFIRRSRLKFDGYAFTPKLKYKAELALSNRDNGGGNSSNFSNAANIILDAFVEWNFFDNLSLWAGQGKMPGNRERVISSGNLQFVDRSRLNSRYTLDRDVGIMLKYHHKIGEEFILREKIAWTSGEGKNITSGNVGGSAITMQIEALPFGKFQSKGDYIGSAIKRETSPKLAVAVAYDINRDAGRERGRKGNFLVNPTGEFIGKDLTNLHADLMFKYQGISLMVEYSETSSTDGPIVLDLEGNELGTYYTGSGINVALGYMMPKNWEIAGRWTDIKPDAAVASNETQYTLGLSKYVVGHKLKVQSDITYRSIETSEDDLIYRMQMDIHF